MIKLPKINNPFKGIIDDTLKRYDDKLKKLRFSRTSLTMVSAWFTALFSYLYDLFTNGFRTEAFVMVASVAVGIKIGDSFATRIEPKKEEAETMPEEGC